MASVTWALTEAPTHEIRVGRDGRVEVRTREPGEVALSFTFDESPEGTTVTSTRSLWIDGDVTIDGDEVTYELDTY